MDKKLFKSIILLATICMLLIAFIIKLDWVLGFISALFILLSPLFIGVAIAFVLNPVYGFFIRLYSGDVFKFKKKNKKIKQKNEKNKIRLLNKIKHKKFDKTKLIRIFSLITTYIFFLSFIALIMFMLIPELVNSTKVFVDNFSSYTANLEALFDKVAAYLNIEETLFTSIEKLLNEFISNFSSIATGIFPRIFDFTKNIALVATNIIVGFIMSIYMLASKETLFKQCRDFSQAFFSEKLSKSISEHMALINRVFSGFVTGRLVDSLLVGLICFICMNIFGFEYPLLISVIIGVTNIIPVFGPFMGAVPSIFILLMIEPIQALWFALFILVLQQVDGNILDPRITGGSIGLPPLWSMLSIFVGGGLFGIVGMLAGVPTFAVLYALVQQETSKRLSKKNEEIQ